MLEPAPLLAPAGGVCRGGSAGGMTAAALRGGMALWPAALELGVL